MSKLLRGLLFLVVVVGIVLYAAGAFTGGRVAPGKADAPAGLSAPERTVRVERAAEPVFEEAVGTVRSQWPTCCI